MIRVYNDYIGKYHGSIKEDGSIIENIEWNKIEGHKDDHFNLSKLIIEEKNYDKRYDIGVNELKRLKNGESIVKGCLFGGNNGTGLIFLRFEKTNQEVN